MIRLWRAGTGHDQRTRFTASTCLCLGFTLVASTALAQSLAEIARREEARRKAIGAPARLLTNKDLDRAARGVAPEPASVPGAPAAGSPPPAADAGAARRGPEPPVPDREQQEAAWRARITEARANLERTGILLDALQTYVNGLTNEFYARDDPAQRAVIANDRIRTLAEMDRLRQQLKDQEQTIADIEEQARRAGVPPGWLR